MSYEDQLIREATGDKLLHDGYENDLELQEPVDPIDSNETGYGPSDKKENP